MIRRLTCRSMGQARTAWWLVLAITLLAVACGDSSEPEPTASTASTSTETTATPEATPTPEPEPTVTPEPEPEPTVTPEATPMPEPEPEPEPTVTPDPVDAAESAIFAERGPLPVGVLTASMGDRDVEIWYPADPASTQGQPTEVFNSLAAFPASLQAIIPPELSGDYDTLSVRDATPDLGEYPVLIYGHGFGGYRQIATHFTSHVASWGFVVVSVDHLERGIAEQTLDLVGSGLFDETNSRPDASVDDVRNTLALLADLNDDGPLANSMLLDQIAISGHSAGAWAAVQAAAAEPDAIAGWISIAGGTRDDLVLTQPGMVIIGELDAVVPAERSYELYESAGVPQLLISIEGAGHNSFTDPCRGITDLGGLGALTALLGEAQVARAQDGCTSDSLSPETAQAMVNHVTVAWLLDLFGESNGSDLLDQELIETLGPLADYQRTQGE